MDWTLRIRDDDGFVMFEVDVHVYYTDDCDDPNNTIEVTGFRIRTPRTNPDTGKRGDGFSTILFDADSDTPWAKHLFLHVKEMLESDPDFTSAALESLERDEIESFRTTTDGYAP